MSDQFTNFTPYTRSTSRKGRAFLLVGLFLALVGGAIFLGNMFLTGQTTSSQTVMETPTPTPTNQQVSPTQTASPTGTLTPTPDDEEEELSIEVLNGSGTSGAAGELARVLEDAGYNVSSTGNADNFDYELTTIQVKKSRSSAVNALKETLSDDYSLDPKVGTLAETADVDVIVIVGAQ